MQTVVVLRSHVIGNVCGENIDDALNIRKTFFCIIITVVRHIHARLNNLHIYVMYEDMRLQMIFT